MQTLRPELWATLTALGAHLAIGQAEGASAQPAEPAFTHQRRHLAFGGGRRWAAVADRLAGLARKGAARDCAAAFRTIERAAIAGLVAPFIDLSALVATAAALSALRVAAEVALPASDAVWLAALALCVARATRGFALGPVAAVVVVLAAATRGAERLRIQADARTWAASQACICFERQQKIGTHLRGSIAQICLDHVTAIFFAVTILQERTNVGRSVQPVADQDVPTGGEGDRNSKDDSDARHQVVRAFERGDPMRPSANHRAAYRREPLQPLRFLLASW